MGNSVSSSLFLLINRIFGRRGYLTNDKYLTYYHKLLGGAKRSRTRTYQTGADKHYSRYRTLISPSTMHAILPPPPLDQQDECKILVIGDVHGCLGELQSLVRKARKVAFPSSSCQTPAVENSSNLSKERQKDFYAIVLTGDLVNKGPYSLNVLRYLQSQGCNSHLKDPPSNSVAATMKWFAVRGNHDHAALEVALNVNSEKRAKRKYKWLVHGEKRFEGETTDNENKEDDEALSTKTSDNVSRQDQRQEEDQDELLHLSDEDVTFLAELPYTMSIPWIAVGPTQQGGVVQEPEEISYITEGVRIVHAGFVPGISVAEQAVRDMLTLRDVISTEECESSDTSSQEEVSQKTQCRGVGGSIHKAQPPQDSDSNLSDACNTSKHGVKRIPWASAWEGKEQVIFGHDAKRGLQQYFPRPLLATSSASRNAIYTAIGLDTGACYGNKLTGVILPDYTLVSVNSMRTYTPVKEDFEVNGGLSE